MKHVTRSGLVLALAASALILSGACSKEKDNEAKPQEPAAAAPKEPAKPVAAPAAAQGDFIKIYGAHEPRTPADPVEITIETFAVKSASFDPANLEGATAELELDLSSIKSDAPKRDNHLRSADYLDVAQFGKATVKIADVKKEGDNTYAAQAEISAHGMTRTWPVKFTVLESKDDSIRIEAEHAFDRLEFAIGKEPDGENEKVAKEVTVKMQLTLTKS